MLILARFGTGEKGKSAARIIEAMQEGRLEGVTCSLTLDELMWAILRQKQGSYLHETIREAYSLRNFRVVETSAFAPLAALEFIAKYGLKPRDAIHCAMMQKLGVNTIYSDDADFDKVDRITRKF